MSKRVLLEQEELLYIPTSELKHTFNTLSEPNQSAENSLTITNLRNTKSMVVNFTATLNDNDTLTLNLNWCEDNIPYTQTLTVNRMPKHFVRCFTYCYYFKVDDKQLVRLYLHEHAFKTPKDCKCRLESRSTSKEQRMLKLLQNPPKHNGKKKVKAVKGKLTKYGRAYERYQIKLNDFLMAMYDLSSSGQKAQLDKFMQWSETLKESIKNME